jgi:REP element-mobilizing transposase RayT
MPYIKIWIHLIWATKNRHPFLTQKLRPSVFEHIRENALSHNIYPDFINGYKDHVHLLISMNAEQSVAKIVHLLKGESSHWINQNKLVKGHFAWQEEYIAVSVSFSGINRVREYIKNQDEHHRLKTLAEEWELFLGK